MLTRWLAFLTTLIAAAVIGYGAAQPMRVQPANAAPSRFSAERAMADVRAIAERPHPTGSADNARVRALLATRLRSLGFAVVETAVPLSEKGSARLAKWGDSQAAQRQAVNLVAVRPGTGPYVALMAHYDSVWGSPGAADDAAGVAAALEIARAVQADAAPARPLMVILTDAEELGLDGARGLFASPAFARQIGVLVNMETRGGGGRAAMFETGPHNGAMIDLLRRHATMPSANSLAVKIYELLPNSTDYTVAKALGIPGFNYAFLGHAALYHSPLATPEALDPRALQDMGAQALDVTRALLVVPTLPGQAPDAVFSDVLGGFIIAYPAWVGWLLLGLAGGLILFAARRQARDWRGRELAVGGVAGLAAAAITAALAYGANLLSGADGPTNYYDRLAALPRIEWMALLLALAALVVIMALVRSPRGRIGGWIGLALLNLVLAIAVQVALPAASPVLTWPLLLAVLALALNSRVLGAIPAMAAAALGLAQLGGIAHFALLAIGITAPSAIAALVPMALLLLWPLLPVPQRRSAWLAALVLVALAAGLALWVRLDPVAPSVAVYSEAK